MTFTVTYRDADGALRTEAVEAASRADCLAQMKARGVSVQSVKAYAGKHTSHGGAKREPIAGTGRNRHAVACVLSVACVLLAGGIGWYWLSGRRSGEATLQNDGPKKPSAFAKEVKPAAAPKAEAKPEKKDYANLDNIALRRLPESETNNLTAAQVKYWEMFHPNPPPNPNHQPKAKIGHYRIFKSRADNEIAFVVATRPGTMVLGSRSVGPDFERRFLKSIETPIIVSENDSDHDKELKRAVIAAKIELKAAYDRGEDIGKVMDDARDQIQRLGRYKAQLEKEALKVMRKEGITSGDAGDVVAAMNKMLEAKGIAPVELNSMSRIALKYQNIARKEENGK